MAEYTNIPILLVDDDPDDCFMLDRAMKKANLSNPLHSVHDGLEALDYLKHAETLPGLMLVDVNMPCMGGLELLTQLGADPAVSHIPVIMLTTSSRDSDILQCYQAGAVSYLLKPDNMPDLIDLLQRIRLYWLDTVKLPFGRH